jgi:hypothetical protein
LVAKPEEKKSSTLKNSRDEYPEEAVLWTPRILMCASLGEVLVEQTPKEEANEGTDYGGKSHGRGLDVVE